MGGGGVVTSSLGGGLGAGFSGASVYGSTAPVITEVIAAPSITTMAAPVTMAAPMMTEVIAAPAIPTMAVPVTMAAPMITEVIGSTMATPLATIYGALPW